jgi:ketosteroid isomerase-like protein
MADADIDVVCDSLDAFRKRDLDAWLGFLHPDVEFTSLVLEIEGVYRGREGARSWWESVVAVFPEWSPRVVDSRKVGDSILVRVRAEGAGTGSGIDLDRDFWQVAEVEDGLLRSWRFFRTEQEALDALTPPGAGTARD